MKFNCELKSNAKQNKEIIESRNINSNHVPIIFAINSDFQQHVAVAVESISKYTSMEKLKLYILSEEDVESFRDLVFFLESKSCIFEFVQIDASRFSNLNYNVFNVSCYYRFFIPDYIHEDKVIYLDGDIILKDDISKLYEEDISDYYLAAVKDTADMISFFKRWSLPENSLYINSGVLLINNEKLRNEKKHLELFEFAITNHYRLRFYDQDAINIVLNNKIKILPEKWNYQSTMWYDPLFRLITPSLIHFTGGGKPWEYSSYHPAKNYYYEHLANTPWKNYIPYLKISVIIPVYNASATLARCLNSILNQSLRDYEVIIVDDGSTDNTQNIIAEYCQKFQRIRCINLLNQGGTKSRVRGVQEARGEYVFIIQQDGNMETKTLNLLYEKANSDKADMVYFNYTDVYGEVGYLRSPPIMEELFNVASPNLWSKLIKTELIKNIDYDELPALTYQEDWLVSIMLWTLNPKISYLKEHLYFANRMHEHDDILFERYYLEDLKISYEFLTRKFKQFNLYDVHLNSLNEWISYVNDFALRFNETHPEIVNEVKILCNKLRLNPECK